MRVIAGTVRGHSLKAPRGLNTRPTLDRVREAIFNVLTFRIHDAVVLDLFSGSGAMGIEALSRGAASCVFTDNSRQAISVIKENLTHTKLESKATVFNMDAGQLLNLLKTDAKTTFDLVFLDPPYESGVYETILSKLSVGKLLNKEALVIAESNTKLELKDRYEALQLIKQSRYGNTLVSYYKNLEE